VSKIPRISAEVFEMLNTQLLPAVVGMYGLNGAGLSIRDVFVVKYDAVTSGGQRGLEMHEDGSAYSFNALLSDPSDFSGGGTRFESLHVAAPPVESTATTTAAASQPPLPITATAIATAAVQAGAEPPLEPAVEAAAAAQRTVSPQQGEALVHRGSLRHEGVPISNGRRYILVGFLKYNKEAVAEADLII
jgi:hypothetical protein